MVNNPYACEEYARQHQAELAAEAARSAFAGPADARSRTAGVRSLFAGLIAGLRRRPAGAAASLPAALPRTRHLRLPHRHAHASEGGGL